MRAVLPGCAAVAPEVCVLLGAAVGAGAVSPTVAKRERGLRDMGDRFALIDRHDALALLRVLLGHPRAVYELRAGAAFRNQRALGAYDAALRDVVQAVVNVAFDDRAWEQSTLPRVLGGIGVRTPSCLALPAFFSSAAATGALASEIGGEPDALVAQARAMWEELAGASVPAGPEISARSWQRPLDEARYKRVRSTLTGPRDVARLLSASTPESAALFCGLPCSRTALG